MNDETLKREAKFSILDTYIRLGMPPAVAIQETETLVRYIFDGVIPQPQFDEDEAA